MEEYYQKEYEAAIKRGASKDYIADMKFLAQMTGIKKERVAYIKGMYRMFNLLKGNISEKKALELCCHKSMAAAFNLVRKHQDKK